MRRKVLGERRTHCWAFLRSSDGISPAQEGGADGVSQVSKFTTDHTVI